MSHSEIATERDRHAIVIGGSIAGLLAARVLTDHFDRSGVSSGAKYPQTTNDAAASSLAIAPVVAPSSRLNIGLILSELIQ